MQKWYWLHKWSSLACTLFLLVVCITGLPLIFIDEISEHWRGDPPAADISDAAPMANLDRLVLAATGPQGAFPGQTVRWLSIEDDKPEIWFGLAPSYSAQRKLDHVVRFDARSGALIRALKSGEHTSPLWLGLMFKLHTDWFAGIFGELFLAGMALLFVAATVSGVALYGPFMKNQRFGVLRADKSARLKWLDLHNLLGIATVTWMLVVGLTGILNQLSTPLYDIWRNTEMNGLMAAHKNAHAPSGLSSVQDAYQTALQAMPGKSVRSIRFPDAQLGSPRHYLIWTKGDTPLTSRILQPLLVDAQTGRLAAMARLPWYLTALQVSRPLHFGDYGGLPLKILWVILDLAAITILCSGLLLWNLRRRSAGEHAHARKPR
ncbi:PepSY-associated TM helix domain-containing protein [Herbaspirillum sp. WKF16]|uniref:PepSY-associated TM helix domain-containing protein n=1 Tax=Herbaspirillum sp. WKF16 TaxID=3028312 RepID=UPI0023A92397|nr:PepSY-associated TM helix domain-containing protein [Herbaspirillum sp. WKF16]WDZ97238.1 PepSY-associated TM helix domain-containing protein [Herbaspirillum sp. WKF16]